MKILIDPVYTGKAHRCSTSYLAWELIDGLSKWRDDVFFYLLYPKASEAKEDEWDFLNRHKDRVKLLPYPYLQADRLEEMFKLHEDLIHYLAPGDTPVWDFDVVISSRIQQLPFMRNVSGRESNYPHGTHRLFIGLEEMPVFSFRDTVAWAAGGHMDLSSLAAYQSAGAVVINNLWTKSEVMKVARNWLAPSKVMELSKGIFETVPVKLQRFAAAKPKPLGDKLNVVFTGRMTGTRNFAEAAELFRKHFSYPLNKGGKELRFIVSTNSSSTGSADMGDISFMEVQHNNREKFHALLKEEAHVVVNLSKVEDFSLSTYEPLLFGVPVIVLNYPWTDFLGADYPFRVKDFTQAYAAVKRFATDYDVQLTAFRKWEKTTWKTVVEGHRNVSTLERVAQLVGDHEAYLQKRLNDMDGGAMYRNLVEEIIKAKLSPVDALKFARERGFFYTNSKVFKGIPIGKRASAYLLKVYLNMTGFVDTNEPGVLVKA